MIVGVRTHIRSLLAFRDIDFRVQATAAAAPRLPAILVARDPRVRRPHTGVTQFDQAAKPDILERRGGGGGGTSQAVIIRTRLLHAALLGHDHVSQQGAQIAMHRRVRCAPIVVARDRRPGARHDAVGVLLAARQRYLDEKTGFGTDVAAATAAAANWKRKCVNDTVRLGEPLAARPHMRRYFRYRSPRTRRLVFAFTQRAALELGRESSVGDARPSVPVLMVDAPTRGGM